ncbi:CHASE domain-containing protein [Flavobacterium sp.]|uniref:CHASE domain-containing protein n=1 Tax=Flavobacterium sp. TaxID=239 RepID=UPI002B4B17DD|nr:CHASE domain-containing protein [Flavobacterium sp.]HLF51543.1 CHASE domain-containing protein [Flavobacterium sp.]
MMIKLPFKVWSLITAGLLLLGVFTWLLFADYLFPTISDNFTYQANILSYDNFYDARKNDFSGDILTKTKYGYSVEKKDNNVLTIRNFFDVSKPSGNPIFSVERFYGIDQITGKHVYGFGSKNRDGYLFAPENAGNEFTYWHINYDAPAHMKLRGKEKIEGLIVYRYECDYKADQTSNLKILPGVPEDRGVEMDINLKLWIEPTTGYLIKYEDRTTGWFYDMKTKKRIHPWNRFHNQFEETSISNQVQVAMLAKDFKNWQNWYFPLSILFLILIILSIGYRSDRKSAWRSYFATGLILFTGLTSSIFLYNFLKKNDAIRLETIFNRDCESIRISVQRELERSVEVLNSIKANYVSHRELTRAQFRIAVNHSLKNTKNIQAVAWIPYVPLSNRNAAERQARKDGIADFKFTELQNEQIVSAGKRAVYYPIYYIEPYESNKIALGFDFASSPERKAALEKAASIEEPVVTEPLIMVQQIEEKNNKSFLIMIPLYEDELGLSKNHIVHSYLSEGINIFELMQEAISRVSLSNNVSVTVIDLETKKGEILFSNSRKKNTSQFEKKSSLQVANGLWELQFQSTPILNRLESSWFTIILPIVVALLAFILGIFVFSMLTNESKKLRSINIQLKNEISERKKAEEKLNEHMHVLESQNIQLSDFCYIISHNLRGPLVNISMLIDYIESSGDELEKKEMFDKIKPVVNTINETFNELVESLQVKFDLEIKSENNFVKDSIEKALETLEFEINSSKATIEINIIDAPIINFPAVYLNSILFNLISNSLKYKSPDRTPIITIKTEKINNSIVLSVTDNGLGIDLKMHKNNLFKIRKVFHKHPDARGFGLFMTKTQIDAMGGKIWAESIPNVGSTFFVEFINQNT